MDQKKVIEFLKAATFAVQDGDTTSAMELLSCAVAEITDETEPGVAMLWSTVDAVKNRQSAD